MESDHSLVHLQLEQNEGYQRIREMERIISELVEQR
jgi:hypothetical protein